MSYKELIQFIVDGELVKAGVANRAAQELQGNVDYLKQILEEALIGSTIFVRDATVEIDAKEGQPVFYSSTNLRYERAQAAVTTDTTTGFLVTAPSSWAWGVIHRKLSATKADILVTGVAEIDFTQSISGTPASGMYFLSQSTPGGLTNSEPPISIPVLMIGSEGDDGRYECLVRPDFRDLLTGHKHFRFELACIPAGDTTTPATDGVHTITNPDDTIEGWLPASSFSNAPAGAKFGYNIAASSLNNVWPPIPITNASLEIYHQDAQDGTTGHPITGGPIHSDMCVIDEHGIWWMVDCYGMVPWPTTYHTPVSTSVSDYISCPEPLEMEAILWFGKPNFHTTSTAVLSLRAKEGSGLVITCYGTDDAAFSGHLEIDFDPNWLIGDLDKTGYLAFKSIDNNRKFELGPVVEAVKPLSSNVSITSSAEDSDGFHYGKLQLYVDPNIDGTMMPFETIRLDGAEEEFYQGVIGLGLDPDHESGFTGRIKIPDAAVLPSGTKMKLRFLVLARETGTIPADVFTIGQLRIPRPSDVLDPETLPTTFSSVSITSEVAVVEDEYVEIESDSFTIEAGDVVMIQVTREAPDGYAGDLHLLHKQGILVLPD